MPYHESIIKLKIVCSLKFKSENNMFKVVSNLATQTEFKWS